MQYCENCHAATNEEYCPLCGGKKLRPVQEDDFCLVTERSTAESQSLLELFDENGINYSALPYGSGVEAQFGIPLKNYRVFVPYSQFEKAKSIVSQIDGAQPQKWREHILKNADLLNITPRLEKKYKKKLKLFEEDFFGYCINLIKNARKISDKGLVTAIEKKEEAGSHYLYCYNQNITLCINSQTFEIYSVLIS